MTHYGSERSLGARVQAARRARGFRTARDLAAATAGSVSQAVIENIEAGRKADVGISQLLNLAMALRVPPSYLLAPVADPERALDLPNLSEAFEGMTAGEFDSWLSSTSGSAYRAATPDESADRRMLEAMRDFFALQRDAARIRAAIRTDPGDTEWSTRLRAVMNDMERIASFLRAGGWTLSARE